MFPFKFQINFSLVSYIIKSLVFKNRYLNIPKTSVDRLLIIFGMFPGIYQNSGIIKSVSSAVIYQRSSLIISLLFGIKCFTLMITSEDSQWHYIMGDVAKGMGPRKFFLIFWLLISLKTTAVMVLFYAFRNDRKALSWLMVQQLAKGEINPENLDLSADDGFKLTYRTVITTCLV